ncbi:hypothetical protein EDB84DRAFT_1657862 [Lactarius hengduanensis]|nr:hypothetical protein EDB84DRAFT_1657862 [Lactarius hengduanensis]
MHLLFTPNHVQLITACYPPSASLLTSGPDYHPNPQELSRLTYYAANKPGKINKLSSELEKRIKVECRKAHSNNPRSRASLLISLSIFKALATECRRDISLLTPSLLASIGTVLSTFPSDIEVSAKAANLFKAWTTFTDGRLVGVDQTVTKDYLFILERFCRISRAVSSSGDSEFTNRTRLVGLAALTGVVTSEALYSSSTFKTQVSALVPAVLSSLQEVELFMLEDEQKPLSPYLDEFRTRPVGERRAASIHLHIDGERGPSRTDVSNACLRALSYLFDHSSGGQVAFVIQAAMTSLDEIKGWEKVDHCRWFAGKATEWTQYQFRDAIPTHLIERLKREQDVPTTTAPHIALAAMITTVFTSPTPLVMSTSDVISNLITLVLRRAAINPTDSLLLALTECIGALGTHVYYADQIHDLASELISRLLTADATGLPGRISSDKSRSQALRALIAGLVGLMRTPTRRVDHRQGGETSRLGQGTSSNGQKVADQPARTSHERADGEAHLTNRAKISPETWQDTLNFICDADFPVRTDYANALLVYLESEISTRGEYIDGDGVMRNRPLAVSQVQQAGNMMAVLHGDESTRFLHATYVYLYILATSPVFYDSARSPSSARSTIHEDSAPINVIPATPGASHEAIGDTEDRSSPARSQHARPSLSLPARTRKQSLVRRMISRLPSRITPTSPPLATASDYRNIASILARIHEHLPIRGLLAGVPFLIALSSVAHVDDFTDPVSLGRVWAIREVISRTWLVLGRTWDCSELTELAERALSSMPAPSYLPTEAVQALGRLTEPELPVQILPSNQADGADGAWSGVDPEVALGLLASSKNILDATGMDSEVLRKRFAAPWTAESALRDSTEPQSNYDPLRRDGISPHLRLAPALMHIENLSLQSLARSTRGVGVTDLRDALEGRSSMSNPALVNKAPSLSTLDHTSTHADGPAKPVRTRPQKSKAVGGPSEVREMLSKLHIGKPGNGSNLLRASFPGLQRQEPRKPSTLVPPYKS